MARLIVFNQVSLDGYFTDARGDMSWAHKAHDDREWNEFVEGNASGGGALIFGRITYDMMASFWPTPMASQTMPVVAERMNNLTKIVFSKTMTRATWNNTRVSSGNLVEEITRLKSGKDDMAILGSGSLVPPLTEARLIDEYQVVINPLALGKGKTLFDGIAKPAPFTLTKSRTFKNGNVLLCYAPAR